MMRKVSGIPKAAVMPLIEYCQKAALKSGGSGVDLFGRYLELMKKYGDYFFSEVWPKTQEGWGEFSDEDWNFIEADRSYAEKCDRFVVVCLRRTISLKGFDAVRFDSEVEFNGRMACSDCAVPHVVWLRDHVAKVEQAKKENEEEMKKDKPSPCALDMYVYYRRPEVVREDKKQQVELRFLEEFGDAEGRACEVNNRYACPYKAESDELCKYGKVANLIWTIVEWYNHHWNRSPSFIVSSNNEWYHFDEPSIIDVADYDDIVKALDDGRIDKLMKEYERYRKEIQGETMV